MTSLVRRRSARARLRFAALVFLAALTLLAGRLVQLQGFDSKAYAAKAEQQRLRTVTLPAARGQILDRDGAVLATDIETRTVYADPLNVTDPAATAQTLAAMVGANAADLLPKLTAPGRWSPVVRGLTPEQGNEVTAKALPGLHVVDDSARVHPGGDLAADILGVTGTDGTGLAGVEQAYNADLTGKPGSLTLEEDPRGRTIPQGERKETAAVQGGDVQLTIDRDIQYMVQDTLAATVERTQARSATAVVMDPHTGNVLAMATMPTFNPDDPSHQGLRADPAVANVYEPGSVNKIITMSGAIQEGIANPETPVTIGPSITVAGRQFVDAEAHGVEHLTLAGVLAQSSNIGTIMVAQKLGNDRLYDYLTRFGLGSRTGSGLPGESKGLLPPPDQWSGTQAATIPFGQGMSATALQVANVYATVANGGVRVTPRIVSGVAQPGGRITPTPEGPTTRVISPQTAATVSTMLEQVLGDGGTAPKAAIAGYRVAGKTGTAYRVGSDGRYDGQYIASFVGYAPADNPRVVVEVVVDSPQGSHYGGDVAAPAFHDITSFVLQSLKVPPSGSATPVLPLRVQ